MEVEKTYGNNKEKKKNFILRLNLKFYKINLSKALKKIVSKKKKYF